MIALPLLSRCPADGRMLGGLTERWIVAVL